MLPSQDAPTLMDMLANYLMDIDENFEEWQKQSIEKQTQKPSDQSPSCSKRQSGQDNLMSMFDGMFCTVPDLSQKSSTVAASKPQSKTPTVKSDLFTTNIDLQSFDPSEISVKLEENTLIVSGKHVQTTDGQYECHEYIKKVSMPDNVLTDQIKCSMNQSGQLKIEAPFKKAIEVDQNNGQNIPIEFVKKPQEQSEQNEQSIDSEEKSKLEWDIEDLGPD